MKRIDQFKPSPQVDGKRFELTLIQSNENWIPWDLVPLSIRGPINEMHRDNGIDAVVVNNNQITEIIQIKHHNNTYLKHAEIQTFIAKCSQARYVNTKKILILHGCKLSKKLKALIESNGITIETSME